MKGTVVNPLETWRSRDGWEWRVLRKWQKHDDKPFARWLCWVKSPMVPGGEIGDVYVATIKREATLVHPTI